MLLDTAFLRYDEWDERSGKNDVRVRGDPVSEYGRTSALLRYDEWGERYALWLLWNKRGKERGSFRT